MIIVITNKVSLYYMPGYILRTIYLLHLSTLTKTQFCRLKKTEAQSGLANAQNHMAYK